MSFPGSKRFGSSRGTVSLVALCFAVVLGISLASYITLSSRAMQLSNRSFQAGVSKQLAEVGIEEALRAFNQNNWDDWTSSGISADWTLDTTTKRATATMTFPAGKFGQGTTASVKIRVDNYDAGVVGASWSSSINYRVDDLVGRNGIWYRCIRNHSNQAPPNMNYWVSEGIPWKWDASTTYSTENVVYHSNSWYRYISATSGSNNPPPATSWTAIPSINPSWPYSNGSIREAWDGWEIRDGGDWDPAPISWRWRGNPSKYYKFNEIVYYDSTWYRCINSHWSSNSWWPVNYRPNASGSDYWTRVTSMWTWSSSTNYNLGDVVYHSGTSDWYRCIRAHSGQTPSGSSAYWANTPLFSTEWDAGRQYNQNDTVRYNGVWYLSRQNTNIGQNPSTATSYWIGASTTNASYTWSNATSYSVGAYRCYGGAWYRCIAATTANANHTPNNTTHWTAAWSNSWGITTGAPVVYAEATVNIPNHPAQKTQLRAPIAPAPLFPNAAGATGDLTITTGTGTVDSYDSSLGAYNQTTSPFTASSPNISDTAVLAAGGALAINGTTAVKGYLAAPTLPANISTGTTVQEIGDPASPNLAPDRLSRSPHVPQFGVVPTGNLSLSTIWNPLNKGTALPGPTSSNQTLSLGTPGATTPSRYHYDGDLQLETGDASDYQYINISGPVILYVKGSLRLQSGSMIQLTSTGSLQITYGSIFRAYTGSAGIYNRTQDPKKLILITDSTTSQATFWDNGGSGTNKDFHGVVYAPNNTSSVGLEFRDGIHVYGAISAKEITFSSEANLHYDTSLRYATFGGVDQPYAVTEWRELPATEQATVP